MTAEIEVKNPRWLRQTPPRRKPPRTGTIIQTVKGFTVKDLHDLIEQGIYAWEKGVKGRLVIGRYIKSERGLYERAVREEDVLGACRQLLELNGARVFRAIERVPKCYRCGQWLGASEPGTPDLSGYFYKKGIVPFWIEMKRPKGKIRPAQLARIEQIQADGGIAFFADGISAMVTNFQRYGMAINGLQR